MSIDGMVVGIMLRMCANTLVSVTAAARLVVSDRGDILSPKNEPETTAPAVQYSGMPKAVPMPTSARPTVPTVVQLEPIDSETTEQSSIEAARNQTGSISSRP